MPTLTLRWLWPWSEAMSVVLSTFRSALDRMNENPDFTFTASSAQFYEWVAETDPKMLEEIRKRVEEGRWAVVGGWWVEPDVNIPNGESLVRQGLYSQRLFQQLFGRMAQIGYNPDSFGHTGTLPQILKLQGMHAYVFMRPPVPREKTPRRPFLVGRRRRDAIAHLSHSVQLRDSRTSCKTALHDFISDLQEPTKSLMVFYGAGDHGGGRYQGEHPIHPGHAETSRVRRQSFSAPRTATLTRSASSPISRSWPMISSITPWAAIRQCRKSRRTTGPRKRRLLPVRNWRR